METLPKPLQIPASQVARIIYSQGRPYCTQTLPEKGPHRITDGDNLFEYNVLKIEAVIPVSWNLDYNTSIYIPEIQITLHILHLFTISCIKKANKQKKDLEVNLIPQHWTMAVFILEDISDV